MILLALAVFVLGSFVPLMYAAARGSKQAQIVGVIEGLLFVVGTGFAALAGVAFLALKCDESCDENVFPEDRSGEWWHTLDAWQWNAQAALVLAALAAGLATVVLPLVRRYGAAAAAAAVLGLAAFCAWALLMATLGHQFGI